MDTCLIRSSTSEDEASVTALWRDAGLVTSYNDPSADFCFARASPSSDVLVCEEDGRVVGSVMVGHDGHRGWLYYVASSVRGKGVGKALVAAGEQWLRDKGVAKVQLLIREANGAVVPFYERLGFAVEKRVVMTKSLR